MRVLRIELRFSRTSSSLNYLSSPQFFFSKSKLKAILGYRVSFEANLGNTIFCLRKEKKKKTYETLFLGAKISSRYLNKDKSPPPQKR